MATKQKAETLKRGKLKPESGNRKAKARGVKKQGRKGHEDGEGKEEPLTAAGVHARKGLRWSCLGGIVPP
jgi:hypothetical protein